MCRVTHKLPILIILVLLVITSEAWGASGNINITFPGLSYATSTAFTVTGTYVMTEDNTPTGDAPAGDPALTYCPSGAVLSASYWDTIQWVGTHADLHYEVNGVYRGRIGDVRYTGGATGTSTLGVIQSFSAGVNIAGLDPYSSHTVTIYFQDIYGACCKPIIVYCSNQIGVGGSRFASASLTFRICPDKDGDGYSTCDGDCDDNDSAIYPGAPEICDWKDNNCNGEVDEGLGVWCHYTCSDDPSTCKICPKNDWGTMGW